VRTMFRLAEMKYFEQVDTDSIPMDDDEDDSDSDSALDC
jgi:hypothetical protein